MLHAPGFISSLRVLSFFAWAMGCDMRPLLTTTFSQSNVSAAHFLFGMMVLNEFVYDLFIYYFIELFSGGGGGSVRAFIISRTWIRLQAHTGCVTQTRIRLVNGKSGKRLSKAIPLQNSTFERWRSMGFPFILIQARLLFRRNVTFWLHKRYWLLLFAALLVSLPRTQFDLHSKNY